ncbi:hypothetical protein Tcan_00820, partial [Toxocara canis]
MVSCFRKKEGNNGEVTFHLLDPFQPEGGVPNIIKITLWGPCYPYIGRPFFMMAREGGGRRGGSNMRHYTCSHWPSQGVGIPKWFFLICAIKYTNFFHQGFVMARVQYKV